VELEGGVHHVTARCVDPLRVFDDALVAGAFVDLLADACDRCGWRTLAYCLMPNHLHLLVRTPQPNLGEGMRRLQGMTAQRVNRVLNRRGAVWGDRFHSRLVRAEQHVVAAAVYVVVNPVRAGIVPHPGEWPASSYHCTVAEETPPAFLDGQWLLDRLDPRPEQARRLYAEMVDAEVARIRRAAA
jgi:REP element-mobilizing transposase RayT